MQPARSVLLDGEEKPAFAAPCSGRPRGLWCPREVARASILAQCSEFIFPPLTPSVHRNTPAFLPHNSLAETSLEDWHHVMGVNLHSAFYLARAVIPGMKERKRGSIIAIGGQSSLTGRPNTAAVTAAKTGTLGLVRALAAELGPFGIRANMVIPGTMDTERRYAEWYPEFRQAPPGGAEQLKQIPLGRLGRPEEIADACVFLASDASAYITGDEIRVMGGRIIG